MMVFISGISELKMDLQFQPAIQTVHHVVSKLWEGALNGGSRGSFSLAGSASVISLGTTLGFKLSLCLSTTFAPTAERATDDGVKEPIDISISQNPHGLPH